MKINASVRSRLKKKLIQELKGNYQRKVVVKSAFALEEAQLSQLKEVVPELKDAELTQEVDDSIIGGIVIVDGSKIIDISVKGSLDSLVTSLL